MSTITMSGLYDSAYQAAGWLMTAGWDTAATLLSARALQGFGEVPARNLAADDSSLGLDGPVSTRLSSQGSVPGSRSQRWLADSVQAPYAGYQDDNPTLVDVNDATASVTDSDGEAHRYTAAEKGKGKDGGYSLVDMQTSSSSSWHGPMVSDNQTVKLTATIVSSPEDDKIKGYSLIRLHDVEPDGLAEGSVWKADQGEPFDMTFREQHQHVRVQLSGPIIFKDGRKADELWIQLNPSVDWNKAAQAPVFNEDVEVTFVATSLDGLSEVRQLKRRARIVSNIREKLVVESGRTEQRNVFLSLEDLGTPLSDKTESTLVERGPAVSAALWEGLVTTGTVSNRAMNLVPDLGSYQSCRNRTAICAITLEPLAKSKPESCTEKWEMTGKFKANVIGHPLPRAPAVTLAPYGRERVV